MARPKWFYVFTAGTFFMMFYALSRDLFTQMIGVYYYEAFLGVMIGIISVRMSYLIIRMRKVQKDMTQEDWKNYNEMQAERKHQNQLIKEQLSGMGNDAKEFFHMLRQKSFWKIFKDSLRMG